MIIHQHNIFIFMFLVVMPIMFFQLYCFSLIEESKRSPTFTMIFIVVTDISAMMNIFFCGGMTPELMVKYTVFAPLFGY